MASQLDAECLLAAIGVKNAIEGKSTLHKYQVQEAANLPKEIRRIMFKFLATDGFEPAEDYEDYDYSELKKTLAHGQTSDMTNALHAAVPDPDLAQILNMEIGRIMQWANGVLPRETRKSVRGPIEDMPAPATLSDFGRLWQVVCDPMAAMRDLAEGCLSEDQVAALAQNWPALYGEMRQAASDGIATMGGRSKTWEPTMRKAAQLGILRQEPDFDPELAGAVQGVYAQAQQEQAPPKPSIHAPDSAKPDLTPGQRASGG